MTQTFKHSRKVIDASGWSNPLSHDFKLENQADVTVWAVTAGVATELSIGIDYTLDDIGLDAGYEVNIVIPTPGDEPVWWDNDEFVLDVHTPINQPDDVDMGGSFGARFEEAVDKLSRRVMVVYDMALRSIKAPINTDPVTLDQSDLEIDPELLIDFQEAVTGVQEAATAAEEAALEAEGSAGDAETAQTATELARDQTLAAIAALSGPMVFQGVWDASAGTFPGTVGRKKGWAYTVTTGGTVGGQVFETNDMLVALVDNASTTVYAANWIRIEADLVQSVAGLSGIITAVDLRDAMDTAPYVATRTAMKALDTTKETVCFLTEAGREGVFKWVTGDFTARHAADTTEGLYVKATAIASSAGSWVRQHDGTLRPEWFGASPDITVDSTTALGGLAAVVNMLSLPVKLSAIYKTTAVLAFTASMLTINGVGDNSSGIFASNCGAITLTQTTDYQTFSLRDFVLLTDVVNTRKAFVYSNSVNKQNPADLTSIAILGKDRFDGTGTDHGWLEEVTLTKGNYTYLDRVRTIGREADITAGAFPTATFGLKVADSSQVYVSGSAFSRKKVGIDISGFSEGIDISHNILLGCGTGVHADAGTTGSFNDLTVASNHINCAIGGINLVSTTSAISGILTHIVNNSIFCKADAPAGYIGVRLEGANFTTVTGNEFYDANGASPSTFRSIVGIGARRLHVHGNMFFFCYTLVDLDANSVTAAIHDNYVYDNGTTILVAPLVDPSANATVGRNWGTRSGTSWIGQSVRYTGVQTAPVLDINGVASGVNYLQYNNAIAGAGPSLTTQGSDTDINLVLTPKGAGNVTTTKGLRLTGASQGLGYGTGAGSAVTQLTSKSTGVTANRVCGQITTHNASLAAGAEVSFTVTNSSIVATDTVIINIASGATAGAYVVFVDAVAAGSFRVSITNQSAGALGEALVLNFAILRAVAS